MGRFEIVPVIPRDYRHGPFICNKKPPSSHHRKVLADGQGMDALGNFPNVKSSRTSRGKPSAIIS
jgi:hypothetical protein